MRFGVENSMVPGHVYFVEATEVGRIKIGWSGHVISRLCSLRLASPVELRGLGVVEGTMALEAELHERFASCRHHGEWFQATPELMAYIRENAEVWPKALPRREAYRSPALFVLPKPEPSPEPRRSTLYDDNKPLVIPVARLCHGICVTQEDGEFLFGEIGESVNTRFPTQLDFTRLRHLSGAFLIPLVEGIIREYGPDAGPEVLRWSSLDEEGEATMQCAIRFVMKTFAKEGRRVPPWLTPYLSSPMQPAVGSGPLQAMLDAARKDTP